jgi:hypothetical protein
MRAKVFVLAAFLVVTVSLSAQENEKIRYSNITEFGFLTTSIKGVCLEATTVHGISINKAHHLGLGFGIGGCFYSDAYFGEIFGYMPIFLNYRLYFKPDKTFSPHVNVALGGLTLEEGYGLYSSLTMGFRAGKFSFSSGLSFMPMYKEVPVRMHYDNWGGWYGREKKWSYPFGITLKWGFAF